jgi:hypothetical protein
LALPRTLYISPIRKRRGGFAKKNEKKVTRTRNTPKGATDN